MPPELLESHDSDEMDMSDDDETASHLRYGKRPRNDIKVFFLISKKKSSLIFDYFSFLSHRMWVIIKSLTQIWPMQIARQQKL